MVRKNKLVLVSALFSLAFSTSTLAKNYTMHGTCTLQFLNSSGNVVLVNLRNITTIKLSNGRAVLDLGEDVESFKLDDVNEAKQLFSDFATCLNEGKRVDFN